MYITKLLSSHRYVFKEFLKLRATCRAASSDSDQLELVNRTVRHVRQHRECTSWSKPRPSLESTATYPTREISKQSTALQHRTSQFAPLQFSRHGARRRHSGTPRATPLQRPHHGIRRPLVRRRRHGRRHLRLRHRSLW